MEIIWIILYGIMFYKLKNVYLAVGNVLYCFALFFYLHRKHRLDKYGLRRIKASKSDVIFSMIPFVFVILSNLCCIDIENLKSISFDSFIVSICAVFIEEFFFRGWIFVKFYFRGCVIVFSGLFALSHLVNLLGGADVHYTMFQLLWAFCMGVSFTLITILLKSLWPAIVIHTCINISAFGISELTYENCIVTSIITVLCMVYLVIFYYLHLHKEKRNL